MKLIRPSFEILSIPKEPIKFLEQCARTCYKSEHKIGENSAEKLIKNILKRGHESVIEHCSISVKIICDRGVSHEIVRHRLASYSQESTRYCNYGTKIGGCTFIIPVWCKNIEPIELNPLIWELPSNITSEERTWMTSLNLAEKCYLSLLKAKWSPQQARSVLPNSLKTEIVMTANLREWKHFFKLRTSNKAHPQMREIAIPLLNTFKKYIPIIFEDI